MLESGLFFALGFLAAALLALMVAPAIWRRAVVLTRKRIESSVPLTLNEIQSDKDQLRAEFAMSTRRLEVSLETLKERAAGQMIEINRRRDEMLQMEDELNAKLARIADIEGKAADMQAELRAREAKLAETGSALAAAETQLHEKLHAYERLERKYNEIADEFDGQKIELVARETRLESERDIARELKDDLRRAENTTGELKSRLQAAEAATEREKRKVSDIQSRLDNLQAERADLEARIERRDADLARMRARQRSNAPTQDGLQQELDAALSDKIELEAKLAALSLQSREGKSAGGSAKGPSTAALRKQMAKLKDELKKAQDERTALAAQLSASGNSAEADWQDERRENALIRERINDLAAQVTAMTAAMEGENSPINEAVADGGRKNGSTKRNGAQKARPAKAARKGADAQVVSLADRIRALQDAAGKA